MNKGKKHAKKDQKKELKEEAELKEEKGGFPEDIDFKRFLGCGG
ncbi:hypothetical protein [Ekhidna sp.]